MSLQPSPTEISYLQSRELERYVLKNPEVTYLVWTNRGSNSSDQDDRWGGISTKSYATGVVLNADYSWDKKMKEHRDGVWIKTNKIEITFTTKQLIDNSITPKLGDVIELMGKKHEVLSAEPTNLIMGTQYDYLHWVLVIDTQQTIEP